MAASLMEHIRLFSVLGHDGARCSVLDGSLPLRSEAEWQAEAESRTRARRTGDTHVKQLRQPAFIPCLRTGLLMSPHMSTDGEFSSSPRK